MSHLDHLDSELAAHLAESDARAARLYPGDRVVRQPVHTVYVPADRFGPGLPAEWGRQALALLDEAAGSAPGLGSAIGDEQAIDEAVYARVRAKLAAEPIEDLRIDFEDGYGPRPDAEEDAAAVSAARDLRAAVDDQVAPPYVGIRFKCLEPATRRRGLRTLDLFVGELVRTGGLPPGFVTTLPKVSAVEQVEAMVMACARLESEHGLGAGSLRFEIQIETPQAIVGPGGAALVAPMIHAAAGRCTGLHYGTYDYSASCGIAAAYQSMEHPAADYAKSVMQVAAAGTGVHLSDGSTNVLPVGDTHAVHAAWALHARLVRRSLERGFYQGWDMHPGQLPTRYAATFAFFAAGLPEATTRLRAYVDKTDSGFMDEPATARALTGFIVRALQCGATDDAEIEAATGLKPPQLLDRA